MSTTTKSSSRSSTTRTTPSSTTTRSDTTSTQSSGSTEYSKKTKDKKHQDDENLEAELKAYEKGKKSARKRSKAKGTSVVPRAVEYPLDEMFPDMKLLLKRKKDWNFRDPDYIRAAFVESETGMMEEWKSHNAKIKLVPNADIQFKSNLSNDLKMRHLLRKIEKERREKRHLRKILRNFQNPPQFPPVQIFTNATAQLRQSFIRNNPNVPAFVVQHYARFKKPPFKTTKKEHHKVTRCG